MGFLLCTAICSHSLSQSFSVHLQTTHPPLLWTFNITQTTFLFLSSNPPPSPPLHMGFPSVCYCVLLPGPLVVLLQVLDQIRIFVFTLLHFLGIHSTTTPLDVPQPTAEDYVPYMMAVSSPASIKKSLPVVQFSLFRKRLPMGHAQQEPVCAVCLCGLQDKDEVRMLGNCFHGFHKVCIDKWVDLGQVTCPLCRSRLLPRCSRLVDYPIPSSVY